MRAPKGFIFAPLCLAFLLGAVPAHAREYHVGGPVHMHDMEIVANYLVGVRMEEMSDHGQHAVEGPDVIHLEADVHATADNIHGFADAAWIPYLSIAFSLEKIGGDWRAAGNLRAMTAKDGPHYAENVRMNGPGQYRLTYRFTPPSSNGFLRHIDEETGVPPWWQPFTVDFTFKYPQE
jgi:periplasmic iron binding protein